ncbi:helix-turn-helix transcriptional regulator [Allonocardiopsis opalescens]|nr:helix-turn-helix transcriptional regulator [Allonocardiopsis opalescens]
MAAEHTRSAVSRVAAPRKSYMVIDRSPRRARPLPAGEALALEDYRRLVGILEAVDRAPDLAVFCERLLHALQSWFGYTTLAVLHGATLAEAMRDGGGIKSGYSPDFLDEYTARWAADDPFLTADAMRLLTERGVLTLADLTLADAHRRYVEHFLRPNGIPDKMSMVVDGGPWGALYVGVAVRDPSGAAPRDLAVMRSLRRHLAPIAAEHLLRARDSATDRPWRLTPREREVAALVVDGLTNQQVAQRLFISTETVKKHLTRILAETGCTSRTQLAVRWRDERTGGVP